MFNSMRKGGLTGVILVGGLFVILYVPLAVIPLASVSATPEAVGSLEFTTRWYQQLSDEGYWVALWNSSQLAFWSAGVATILGIPAAMAVIRYRGRGKLVIFAILLLPIILTSLLIGISTKLFLSRILGVGGNLFSAVVANTVQCIAFVFLIGVILFSQHNWRYEDLARTCGARPAAVLRRVTWPLVWPGVLAAWLIAFLIGLNELEITYFHLGAQPTVPTKAWGQLRHGLEGPIYAFSTIVIGGVLAMVGLVIGLIKINFADLKERIR